MMVVIMITITIIMIISPRHDGWAVSMSGNAHCHLHSATEGDRTMRIHKGDDDDDGYHIIMKML